MKHASEAFARLESELMDMRNLKSLQRMYASSVDDLSTAEMTTLLHVAIDRHSHLLDVFGSQAHSFSLPLREMIFSLIRDGADVNARCENEFAITKTTDPEILEALLMNGAEPNVQGSLVNPLSRLQGGDTVRRIRLLLDAGANPNNAYKDQFGNNFLLLAEYSHGTYFKREPLEMLLQVGADPNLRDNKGRTAIMNTYCHPVALNMLLTAGADPNAKDRDGQTPLMFVTEKRSLQALRKHGADFNTRAKGGRTVLMNAMRIVGQEPETIAAMIRAGAHVDELDRSGDCALKYAPNAEFVDILLKNKALPDAPNRKGETPLMYWVGDRGTDDYWSPTLQKPSREASRKAADLLLRNGASIHAVDDDGLDALMYAARSQNDRVIKLLLQKKADPQRTSKNGWSCIEWSLFKKENPSQKLIDALLDGGANINGASKLRTTKKNLLGRYLRAENFTYCLDLLKRGAMINRAVLSTLGVAPAVLLKNLAKLKVSRGSEGPLANLVKMLRLDPIAFRSAIDRKDVEVLHALEHLLQQESTEDKPLDGALQRLEPRNWPPPVSNRKRIVVEGITAKFIDPAMDFSKDEYEAYSSENAYRYQQDKTDEEVIEDIRLKVKNKRKIAFTTVLKASDKALVNLWNDLVSRNSDLIFLRGYHGGPTSGASISAPEFKFILARCGVAVIPGMLHLARKNKDMMCRVLLPAHDSRVAPLMADRLMGTSASRIARKWLLRHSDAAIHGLIPTAVGPLGKDRDDCEAALRYIAYSGLGSQVRKIAASYGKEVKTSLAEILSIDFTADYHRKALPKLPGDLFSNSEIKRPIVRATGKPLPERCLPALYGMMSLSTYDDVYPALFEIRSAFEPDSLAEFAWSVFHNVPTKWADHSPAYFGNEKTVAALAPLINQWPRWGWMAAAVTGLDILANIGSDAAIRAINTILLKTKYKPLLERAGEIMETVADVRGLTREQLQDRLVPDFGLDDGGGMTLDFGARAFHVRIDERLKPSLVDAQGKPVKALPRAAKGDDKEKVKEATALWKEFRAGLRKEAPTQLLRLENAMVDGRRWSGADFKSLVVAHPLLRHLARSLVWGEYGNGKLKETFRIDDTGALLGCDGKQFSLADSALVGIPHPLTMKTRLKRWTECLARHKIKQAFPQIGRQTYSSKDDRAGDLFGVQGGKAPTKIFRGMKAKGWKPEIGDAGSIWSFYKELSGGTAHLEFDGIITMLDHGIDDEEKTLTVGLPKKLTPVEFSELVRELRELLH